MTRHGTDHRCTVELGEHGEESSALSGLVMAKGARLSIHEREQRDAVPLSDSTHRLAARRENRCDYEAQAVVAERIRRVKCASQAVERRLTRVPEPWLLVQVVCGDEAAPSLEVFYYPVVAATPDRRVVDGFDVEIPTVGQEIDQRAALQLLRRSSPHFHKSSSGLLRVRIHAWTSWRGERTHTMQRGRRC